MEVSLHCSTSAEYHDSKFPNQAPILFLALAYTLSNITSLKRLVPVAKAGNLAILCLIIWLCVDFGVHGPTPFIPSFHKLSERGYLGLE